VSFGLLADVNWLAALAAAVVYFALGSAWFSRRLFGAPWMRSIGWEPTGTEKPAANALLVEAADVSGIGEGLVLGLVLAVGLVATAHLVTALFEPMRPEPMTWFAVMAGYHGAGVLLAAVIVAVWR
jgi:sterol desaturase/sphingolipid hydroxylase (fatty acid hydroxylase superfamily)